jgi:hypothetical protein
MHWKTKIVLTLFSFLLLFPEPVNGQREESHIKEKEKEIIIEKIAAWKGERVIILPSVIGQALWCKPDYKNEMIYHLIYIQGSKGKLSAAKYAGKVGTIEESYIGKFDEPEVVIVLDGNKEKIIAPGDRIGFLSELDFARNLIGQTFLIKGDVSLGVSAEYCQKPDLRPRYKLHDKEKVTVTNANWGTDLQHIHLFVRTEKGEELLFDGFDGYDYFDERFNFPDNMKENYSRRFYDDKLFSQRLKIKHQTDTVQTIEIETTKDVVNLISTWDPSIYFFMPADNQFTTLEGIKREEYACWGAERFDEISSLLQLLQLSGEGVRVVGDGTYNSPNEIKPKVYLTWSKYEGRLTGAKRFILVERK